MKKSKQAYYEKQFERNWNNIKNTWKRTKSLIFSQKIKYSNETSSKIFLQTTDKEEISNLISSLHSNKASGLNSIPYAILFLLKNKISNQLVDLLNLTFMTGVFPSVLKTAKVVPFLIEIQNHIKATIAQSPCYQILKKYLKSLCIRNCIPFLIMLSLTYSLDSGNGIIHLIP